MLQDFSFGIVPLRKETENWKVLLVKHARAKYWGFPKGHSDPGESPQETAVRELKEETDLDVAHFFSDSPIEEQYIFTWNQDRVHKTVHFFVAEVSGEVSLQKDEVSDSQWVPLAEAAKHLTYDTDKTVIAQVVAIHKFC